MGINIHNKNFLMKILVYQMKVMLLLNSISYDLLLPIIYFKYLLDIHLFGILFYKIVMNLNHVQ